jgi:hypothetical protein
MTVVSEIGAVEDRRREPRNRVDNGPSHRISERRKLARFRGRDFPLLADIASAGYIKLDYHPTLEPIHAARPTAALTEFLGCLPRRFGKMRPAPTSC